MTNRRINLSITLFFLICIMHNSYANPESRVDEIKNIPWEQRTYEDKVMHSTYEDHYTFKHGKPYILDPWTWGYSKEFADRFRMPKQ